MIQQEKSVTRCSGILASGGYRFLVIEVSWRRGPGSNVYSGTVVHNDYIFTAH
jgi:hypothetical protein